MNKSKKNIAPINQSKEQALHCRLVQCAEEVAAIAGKLDAIIADFNEAISTPKKFPPLQCNPLYPAYRKIMDIAADARMGACKAACDDSHRRVMDQMMHNEMMGTY